MHLPTRIKMKTEKSKDNLFSFINEQPSVNKSRCFTEGSFLLFGFHYHLIFGSNLEYFVWWNSVFFDLESCLYLD